VQIDGVLHEFSSIKGVREDVTDIMLNLKQVALRMQGEGPKRLTLRKQGPGEVTAADIEETADVEIINKDHVICTLDEDADVRMVLTVNTGKGYVPAERNRPEDAPIGLVAWMRCTARSSAWPIAWRTPVKVRCSTMTS
jgi:DNA-directed RNA polymerase subunit alpha